MVPSIEERVFISAQRLSERTVQIFDMKQSHYFKGQSPVTSHLVTPAIPQADMPVLSYKADWRSCEISVDLSAGNKWISVRYIC
jgi:hypothetical protein